MTLRPKSPLEIDRMREGGKILDTVLRETARFITVGKTLSEIDGYIHTLIIQAGAKPSFLGYRGFPASSCLSLNSVVVHGVPTSYSLRQGDVLGVDVGVLWQGYHTDAAFTTVIGSATPEIKKLLSVTQEALRRGIESAVEGNTVSDIGREIEAYVYLQGKFGIIRDLTGHGVGSQLQELPEIPNFSIKDDTRLINNLTLAIEPMITLGDWRVETGDDNWSIRTKDNSIAAHFETTVVIQDNDPVILVPFPLSYTC